MEDKQKTEQKKHSIFVVVFILLVLAMLAAIMVINVWDRYREDGGQPQNNDQIIYSENTNTSLTNREESTKVNSLQRDIESLINDLDNVTADEDSMISEIK